MDCSESMMSRIPAPVVILARQVSRTQPDASATFRSRKLRTKLAIAGRACASALGLAMFFSAGALAQTTNTTFGTVLVGSAASAQSISVTSVAGGKVGSILVLTQGQPGLDFSPSSGAGTCSGATLAAHASCTVPVAFLPQSPGLRAGAVVLLDNNTPANVLGTTLISGIGKGGLGVLVAGLVNNELVGPSVVTVAGNGYYLGTNVGDGAAATSAELNLPSGVAVDGAGNLYIADTDHNRIRMVAAPVATGNISTVAGNGASSYSGDGGPATAATLIAPGGLALDGAGNVFIADSGNNAIREINAVTGIITTVAGNGTPGNSGDGGAATAANLNGPQGITVDADGNLWIADTGNNVIREVTAADGKIKTVAGTGTAGFAGDNGPAVSAQLNAPYAIAFDLNGDWFIPDSNNFRVRKVDTTGAITTIAGNGSESTDGDGGSAISAGLFSPSGLAVDPAGNVYISARAKAEDSRIRKVNEPSGIITTVAENLAGTYYSVSLYGPIGMAMDGNGNIFFADTIDMQVKEIQSNHLLFDLTASGVRQGQRSAAVPAHVENDGNDLLTFTALTPTATSSGINVQLDAPTTTCSTAPGASLAVDADCVVGVVFAPALSPSLVSNTSETSDLDIVDDAQPGSVASNSPLAVSVWGTATPVNSTSIVFVNPIPSTINFGASVTYNVNVSGTGALTGTVTFTDVSQSPFAVIGSGINVDSSGNATLALTQAQSAANLPVGLRQIKACYDQTNDDPAHTQSCTTDPPANSKVPTPPQPLAVLEQTQVVLTSSATSPSTPNQTITFTAAVSPSNGGGVVPTGTVIFYDGTAPLNSSPLSVPATGVVTYSLLVPNGNHSITAVYTPDSASPYVSGSTSKTLAQDVLAPATITLISSTLNPIYGAPVTFTVTVSPAPTGAAGTENVNILVNGQNPQAATAAAAGTWTFTTTSLPVGTDAITAAYLGDASLAAVTSTAVNEAVSAAPTTIQVTAPASAVSGEPVTFAATVTANAPSAATPTGTVTFMNGSTNLVAGSGALVNGAIQITPTLHASPNPYSIVVNYTPTPVAGGADFQTQSYTFSLNVPYIVPTVSVTLPATSPTVKTPVQFQIAVTGTGPTPTGTVTLNDVTDGTSTPPVTLVNGAATVTWPVAGFAGAGTYALTANYLPNGDQNYQTAQSKSYSLQVVPIQTQTILDVTSASNSNPQPVVVASVTSLNPSFPAPISEGNVTFMSGTTQLAVVPVQSGFATLPSIDLPSTVTSVTASYAEVNPEVYGPSQVASSVSVQNAATDFTMQVNKTALTISASQNANLTVTLTPVNGFNEQMAFGCGGLPVGVTCTFTVNGSAITSLPTLSGTAPLLIGLNIDTNNPLSGGATVMNARPQSSRTALAALLWPFSLFFGAYLWRFRKRHAMVTASLLVLLLGGASMIMNGCGGLTQSSAKPGTYSIQVVASGYLGSSSSSNVSHSQTVALTIQ
jgi:sugar lactone lactonase YvrE